MPQTPEQRRRRKHRLKLAGLCPACGRKPIPGRTRCVRCITRDNNTERRRKARAKSAGLCPRCSKGRPEPGYAYCSACVLYGRRHPKRNLRARTGALVAAEWRNQGCSDCPPGTIWPICAIDAHHINGKDRPVIWAALSAVQALDELDACIPLCANHHRMRHGGIQRRQV